MNEKDTRQNLKVTSEDYKKIQEWMTKNNMGSNSEFTHFIAENLSRLEADSEVSTASTASTVWCCRGKDVAASTHNRNHCFYQFYAFS